MQNFRRNQRKTVGLNLSASYIGRFAPSPTGLLHLGSLFTALAGFLDARRHGGLWLLRIDDLDTPRNMPNAIPAILDCLYRFGLIWDGEIYYQSRHLDNYAAAIAQLQAHLYACACSRKQLGEQTAVYPGFCRLKNLPAANHALRIITPDTAVSFTDIAQGDFAENLAREHGDFVIKRKDGVFAYQLAVVIDDNYQQVTHVVRGVDLLDCTCRQIYLQDLLNLPRPAYMHLPVLVDQQGNKLSKQTLAAPVDPNRPSATLFLLLNLLRQNPPENLHNAAVNDILAWAIDHWRPEGLFHLRAIKI